MYRPIVRMAVLACVFTGLVAAGEKDQDTTTEKTETQKKELKLEDLIPEKSVFGPSAGGMKFSSDGSYAAYLYRPYKERRHGNDLYLFEAQTQESTRITMASVMAGFQESTRKVVEDRKKKAQSELEEKKKEKDKDAEQEKKEEQKETEKQEKDDEDDKQEESLAAASSPDEQEQKEDEQKDEQEDQQQQEQEKQQDTKQDDQEREQMERGDWVSDKDADDEKAPRYGGISSFVWSPVSQELLFVSEGDIYRYKLQDKSITRLTHTRDNESSVKWLPDAKGYLFRRGSALLRVVFGEDIERQLDPRFANGDGLAEYELSPDGQKIAFLTSKQTKAPQSSKVEIASYRDRLMKAREVSRQVSDDELGEYELRVYVYQLSDKLDEQDKLTEVFVGKKTLPSDEVRALTWSPDSQRLAFLVYEQDPTLIRIFQTRLDEKPDKDSKKDDPKESPQDEKDKADTDKKDKESDKEQTPELPKAGEILRFLHSGGPNTPRMMEMYYLADNHHIVYLSEQTGFRHLHVLDPLYESARPLTQGPFEVYPIEISKDRKWIFVRATKEHPSRVDVYRVSTKNGRMVRLTQDLGVHSDPTVSPDGNKVLCNLASYEVLRELVYLDAEKKERKTLTDSHPQKAKDFAEPKPTFFDYKNRHGHTIYGMGFKPDDWKKGDKRPCLIYFYGGPLGTNKQVVQASYSEYVYAFPYYMAQKHGYVAVAIDPRGNSGYAGVFEKANFGQVGKPQVEDLVDGVDYLVKRWGVDPKRVAIHGWSFGGFQTQMCMYTETDVFAAGIAGAGPTEWENYNSWYTRHAIGESEPGQANLKEFSLVPLAKNLKGYLLLVHGMEDDNVLYQDTVKVYRELLKAGKETLVDLFLDPTGGHGLGGDVKKIGRYRKYEQFLLRTIGEYEPKEQEPADSQETKKKGRL
ncbi:MAG: S9 family peptidase [Sedimentisphaerales bacterium]|nr:S9 family peptidase [Sedimentisphaerales bacterium]